MNSASCLWKLRKLSFGRSCQEKNNSSQNHRHLPKHIKLQRSKKGNFENWITKVLNIVLESRNHEVVLKYMFGKMCKFEGKWCMRNVPNKSAKKTYFNKMSPSSIRTALVWVTVPLHSSRLSKHSLTP